MAVRLRSSTYGRGRCSRRKPHCSLWKGGLASFGAVRPTLSGAICRLPALGQNAVKESALIAVMRKGAKPAIKAASLQRPPVDRHLSLSGFAQAMDRLQKECPGGSEVGARRAQPSDRAGSASLPAGSGPVWISLARRSFGWKTPDFGGWISLDFLGFSRAKRDLSMGYAGFSLKNFSWPFCPLGVRSGGRKAACGLCGSAEMFIEQA